MQAQGEGRPCRDAQVHERRVSAACAEHVERHQEEDAHHVEVRILEHLVKGARLRDPKVRLADGLCAGGRFALGTNRDRQQNACLSLRAQVVWDVVVGEQQLVDFGSVEHVKETFGLKSVSCGRHEEDKKTHDGEEGLRVEHLLPRGEGRCPHGGQGAPHLGLLSRLGLHHGPVGVVVRKGRGPNLVGDNPADEVEK